MLNKLITGFSALLAVASALPAAEEFRISSAVGDPYSVEEAVPVHLKRTTATEAAAATARHNFHRSAVNPPAKNMRQMTTSATVEASAQLYAEQCIFNHPGGHGYGENLYVTSSTTVSHETALVSATNSWYGEVGWYNYHSTSWPCAKPSSMYTGTQSWYDCGHFTQVAWAASYQLGCGVKTCVGNLQGWSGVNSGTIVVCRYNTPGNYNVATMSMRPYINGTSCSGCPAEASVCVDNLCALAAAPTAAPVTTLSPTSRPTAPPTTSMPTRSPVTSMPTSFPVTAAPTYPSCRVKSRDYRCCDGSGKCEALGVCTGISCPVTTTTTRAPVDSTTCLVTGRACTSAGQDMCCSKLCKRNKCT